MEDRLKKIREEYKHHAAEVGHRARLMKRINAEIQLHEARMEAAAQEEQTLLSPNTLYPNPIGAVQAVEPEPEKSA